MGHIPRAFAPMTSLDRSLPHLVLVVDDNDDVREAIEISLRADGFVVAAAADVTTAFRLVRDVFEPCIVLLDLHMPGLDGWHFLDNAHREPNLRHAAVIIVSGDVAQRGRALERGCAFLPKPARLGTLQAAIEQQCAIHRSAGPSVVATATVTGRRAPAT